MTVNGHARNILTKADTHDFVEEVAAAIERKSWTESAITERRDKKKQVAAKGQAKGTLPLPQPTRTPPTGPKAATKSLARPSRSALAPDAPIFVPRAQAIPNAPLSNDVSIPTGPRADRLTNKAQNGPQGQSRKRKLSVSTPSERPQKQLAHKGGSRNGGSNGHRVDTMAATAARAGGLSNIMPFAPTSFATQTLPHMSSSSDVMNPFDFFAYLSAMMSMGFSGQGIGVQFPNLPQVKTAAARIKCADYETKGICHLGTLCPYDHGEGVVVPAVPEYDPNNASLGMPPHLKGHRTGKGNNSRTIGLQRPQRSSRASFSQFGPSHSSEDTLVVEQIPEDDFNEQHVRDFFSQFGAIVDVQLRAYKRVAVVKFSDHDAAQRAYNSPRAIFDNRFVKVHWQKSGERQSEYDTNDITTGDPTQNDLPTIYNANSHMIDMEEFSKQQARIQKEFEERRKRLEEVTARTNMLDAQLKAKEEELDELRTMLIEKARAKGLESIIMKDQTSPGELAELQAEAAKLFANAGSRKSPDTPGGGLSSGRKSSRQGVFGRHPNARAGRGGVLRLDNRPRSLAVAGVQAGSEKEGALKRHLLNVKGCTGVHPHAERPDSIVVGFEHRFQAEMVCGRSTSIAQY